MKRIWSEAKHNAFTDLIRHRNKWICVFREGSAHVSPDGKLRVITSSDGVAWQTLALIAYENHDLRDAKMTITPEGKLMLIGAAAIQENGKTVGHQTLGWFSTDGETWSEPHVIGDRDVWLWRTTWHPTEHVAYGMGYGTTAKARNPRLRLYRSGTGREFDVLMPELFPENGYPNESSIFFRSDNVAHCLLRRDGERSTGLLGTASPPYQNWTWKSLGVRIGGPHMIELPDGRTVAAVRLYDNPVRTSLCWLEPKTATLTEFLTLPSGGDTSYAGLVWHDDHLWVSYYSGHESKTTNSKTAIYFAKVSVGQPSPLQDNP